MARRIPEGWIKSRAVCETRVPPGMPARGGLYVYSSPQLPPLPDLSTYADTAPGLTTLYAQDGTLLAALSRERREVAPIDRIPPQVIDAFLATQDRRFYSHGGIDYRGTV